MFNQGKPSLQGKIISHDTILVSSQPPRSTQPSTLCGTVKRVSVLGLSNNNEWQQWM